MQVIAGLHGGPLDRRAAARCLAGRRRWRWRRSVASAQEKLKVASIFSTPIEEPWVNQIHEALLHAAEGARHRV